MRFESKEMKPILLKNSKNKITFMFFFTNRSLSCKVIFSTIPRSSARYSTSLSTTISRRRRHQKPINAIEIKIIVMKNASLIHPS